MEEEVAKEEETDEEGKETLAEGKMEKKGGIGFEKQHRHPHQQHKHQHHQDRQAQWKGGKES